MADAVYTPYSTVAKFFTGSPASWIPVDDQERIQAYKAYEDIYWGNPDAFKVVMRGTEDDDKPIYIPSGRQIIETLNRYVAKGFGFAVDPTLGSPAEQKLCIESYQALFDRERLLSKFASAKRFGLIRGDWAFHVTADPTKPAGSRISITVIDPGGLFKIVDEDNIDRVIGYRIAQYVADPDEPYILVTEYLKSEARDEEPYGPISSQTMKLAVEKWDDPEERQVLEDVLPLTMLPPDITAMPVYHIPNFEETGWPYGSSEMRGLETLATAINQSASDEDVALAMQGLGLYYTDSGSPVDANNNEVPWQLGPSRVVEVGAGKTFARVQGVSNVAPFQDHLSYLHDQMESSAGVPSVAMGRVDVTTAESGIALALKMGPILSKAEEKDLVIADVMTHLLYDLRAWFKSYEAINLLNCGVRAAFGEKIPMDRAARFAEINALFTDNVISAKYFRQLLTEEFGYEFPANMEDEIRMERQAYDPYAERLNAEGETDQWGDSAGTGVPASGASVGAAAE